MYFFCSNGSICGVSFGVVIVVVVKNFVELVVVLIVWSVFWCSDSSSRHKFCRICGCLC